MASRALIIAIEDYPRAQSGLIAIQLPGTLDAGKKFKAWLESKWDGDGRAATEREIIFCSEPVLPNGRGATRDDIVEALDELRRKPQSTTEELFFFFSGHGFSFEGQIGRRADIIIASDFRNEVVSGPSCINLDEIVRWLRWHLGPGRHYYFIDACRNPLDLTQIAPGPLTGWNQHSNQEPTTYVLQSTAPGLVTGVGGPFPNTLLEGLRGKGRAKVWDSQFADRMFVNYESLRNYVRGKIGAAQPITSRVEGIDGEKDGVLAVIEPVPTTKCTVKIEAASDQDSGKLFIQRGRSREKELRRIKGKTAELTFEPDSYSLSLKLTNANVSPAEASVDLYDDNTVVFRKLPPAAKPPRTIPPSPPPQPPPTIRVKPIDVQVHVSLPYKSKLRLRHVSTGYTVETAIPQLLKVYPGDYVASFYDNADRILGRKEISFAPQQETKLDLGDCWQGAGHYSIACRLPIENGSPRFSESLQKLAIDADLDVWLALLGGGRILGGDYEKLARFPLHDFRSERAGTAPVYILAGFEDADTTLDVGRSTPRGVKWQRAATPFQMDGIQELYLQTKTPGPQLVSFRVNSGPPYTVASLTIKNRAMLIIVTSAQDRAMNISQYLLPIGGLTDELARRVEHGIRGTNLRDVLFLARAAKAFRQRKDLELQLKRHELDELLYMKWLDPIGCAMAAYEFIRRNKADQLEMVVRNMKRYFSELPDTHALAALSGEKIGTKKKQVPLFSDGLQAFPDYEEWLPFPASHLDFTSPWTAWRSAVGISTD